MEQLRGSGYRVIATRLIRKAGFSTTRARTGAVTLIQMLFLDGVYVEVAGGAGGVASITS